MRRKLIYLASFVLVLGLTGHVDAAKVIDDFESGNLAAWEIVDGSDTITVGPDPLDPDNQCMIFTPGASDMRLRIPWGLPEGETETLYYRFMYDIGADGGTVNLHLGATDPDGIEWGDYYGLSRVNNQATIGNVPDMDVRDGGAYSAIVYEDFEPMRWYQVVLEYDTTAKTYDVYVDAELVFKGARFRSGYTPANLEYILIRVLIWSGNLQNGTVYVDDITVGATPGFAQATAPTPKNGAKLDGTWATLGWRPGVSAVSSDIYVGTNFDEVNEGAANTFIGNTTENIQLIGITGFPLPEGLQRGKTYYWRVDGINDADPESPWKGNIWSFWVPSKAAYNPKPVDGMKFIGANVLLEWSPGENAALHTVYFGTNADEVANATSGGTQQSTTAFAPGILEPDTTYYWRVDEHAGLVETKGDLWSFTTKREGGGLQAEYYDISPSGSPSPPESAFSGEPVLTRIDPGINYEGAAGTSPEPNVVSADGFAVIWTGEIEIPLTGTYTFIPRTADGVILWIDGVENANMWRGQPAESAPGLPLELKAGDIVAVEMWYFQSTSFGGDWTVRLDWESDRFERQTIPAAACSPPLRASRSQPSNGAVDVKHTPQLTWNAGQDAVQHDVYFGADANAVGVADTTTADIYQGRQDETSFLPTELAWNTTYYWRIDEVNDQNPDSPWKGSVWSFTTADFGIFEDFEIYNDVESGQPGSMLVYETWIDGFEIPTNGSTMGYNIPFQPTMETNEVHGGLQSAPMAYNNTGTATFSEVTRTLTPAQDWTVNDIQMLTLWFFGDPANTTGQLYVKINGVQVNYDGDAANLSLAQWCRCDIDLTTVGTNLQSVTSVAIGVQDFGATGTLLLDDIHLYPPINAGP